MVDLGAPGSTSTVPEVADLRFERRSHLVRRIALGLLVVFVLAGLSGALGVRSRTILATDGSLRVAVTYPAIARPALAVPFRVAITRIDGFDHPVEVRISRRWIDSFDENGVSPDPDASTTDGADVVWTFDPPPGTRFTVSLDTRVEPGVQWRRTGTTIVSTGTEHVSLSHTMWILP